MKTPLATGLAAKQTSRAARPGALPSFFTALGFGRPRVTADASEARVCGQRPIGTSTERTFHWSVLLVVATAAASVSVRADGDSGLSDARASSETRALFGNLKEIAASRKLLFGQQNTDVFGRTWTGEAGRSDVKSAVGCYPAVHGYDLLLPFHSKQIPDVESKLRRRIQEAYERGSLITISWHMWNPATGNNFYDATPAVRSVLPGGEHHEAYLQLLARAAAFLASLKGEKGEAIPVLFRPFHEHTGNWFWWGQDQCSRDEFVQLWQLTVTQLRDLHELHNLLLVYSPSFNASARVSDDRSIIVGSYARQSVDSRRLATAATTNRTAISRTMLSDDPAAHMMARYPGDRFVDVIGMDSYHNSAEQMRRAVTRGLPIVVREAERRGKVPAYTECGVRGGLEAAWNRTYYTDLLRTMNSQEIAWRIAYLMVWQNRGPQSPYAVPCEPSDPHLADFQAFHRDPSTIFADRLPPLYSAR